MDRRLTAAGLALAAIGVTALGLRPAPAGSGSPDEPPPLVAGWSARRLPAVLAGVFGSVQLPTRLDDALGGNDACFVVFEGGREAFARRADLALIPASTQKLLVGTAAIHVLGADARFETRALAAGPVRGGRVERLWLVGGGDPVLTVQEYRRFLEEDPLTRAHPVTSLETLADRVVAAGVREIPGGVVGDATRHQGPGTVPTWRSSYISDHDVPYLSALTVNGGWARWEGGLVTATDPAANAASELARLLSARGVVVGAPAASGPAPSGGSIVARLASPPVDRLVSGMLSASDNLMAEILTREIGLEAGREGTTEAGTAAVLESLVTLDVDVADIQMIDGSGLDRGNRATCSAFAHVLELLEEPEFEALDAGLAIAGRTGTLHRRLKGTGLEGRLRAKTGSLRDVVGLVGVLEGRGKGRRPLAFALLANGPFGGSGGVAIQEDVARILDGYPFPSSDPTALAPDAPAPTRPRQPDR